jgi:hypothetical protein
MPLNEGASRNGELIFGGRSVGSLFLREGDPDPAMQLFPVLTPVDSSLPFSGAECPCCEFHRVCRGRDSTRSRVCSVGTADRPNSASRLHANTCCPFPAFPCPTPRNAARHRRSLRLTQQLTHRTAQTDCGQATRPHILFCTLGTAPRVPATASSPCSMQDTQTPLQNAMS